MAHTCRYMLSPTVSTSLGSLEVTSESSPRYGGRSWTARSPPTGPDHSRSRDGSWSGSACSAVGERQASVLSHPEKLSPKTTYVRPDGVVTGMPISVRSRSNFVVTPGDRKSTRLNSSHVAISYAVFCLK